MIKTLIFLLIALVIVSVPGLADENRSTQDWENVEGVTVQPKERVDQIKAYEKKSAEAEKKKLKEGWEQKGFTVQSDQRVQHLNELEKKRREKEIKCTMCTMRCTIVRDVGQTICEDSQTLPDAGTCKKKGDDFLKSCLEQCDSC